LRAAIAMLGLVALTFPTATAAPAGSAAATLAWGRFQPYAPGATAVTYNQILVPAGSRVSVLGLSGPHGTMVALAPHGLLPNREYGAHVHTRSCGPLPLDSGPHYQNVPDPVQPSTNPAYANRDNEVWLDFTTDAHGDALVSTAVDWTFTGRRAHSVVIHEHHTHTGGAAGARLACVKADFS
jgi:Cu-Zn family superoxide dismutase